MRPMLACSFPKWMQTAITQGDNGALTTLNYPVIASPKIDGIRCLSAEPEKEVIEQDELFSTLTRSEPRTRSWKLVPNIFIRQYFAEHIPPGLDGELTVGNDFQACTSGIMSHGGEPDFTYWVFDYYLSCEPYKYRIDHAGRLVEKLGIRRVQTLPMEVIWNAESLAAYETVCLEKGFEGVITRDPEGAYKNGRSTWREQGMVKLKRFRQAEAIVYAVEEMVRNENEAKINETGYQQRSTEKAGMVAAGMLGALLVKDIETDKEFKVGSGFTEQDRIDLWKQKNRLIGRTLTYKFQDFGIKDKPRLPIFVGWRRD